MKRKSIRTFGSFSFYRNIEYIRNDADGSKIYIEKDFIQVKERVNYIIEYICKSYLTSFKSYREATNNLFSYAYCCPLILNNNVVFIFTKGFKNYDNIAINYSLIKRVQETKNGLEITFNSLNKLTVDKTINSFYKTVEKIEKINKHRDYMNI